MTAGLLLTCVLCGAEPAATEPVAAAPGAGESPTAVRAARGSAASEPTRDAVRETYRELIRETHPTRRPDPLRYVEPLVSLHRELPGRTDIGFDERRRMQAGIEVRLVELATRLRHDVAREKRSERTSGASSAAPGGSASGGRSDRTQAQSLIDLIQQTIAPESWDVNGGKGSIRYWRPGLALVIRNTGEVHEQVGGALGAVRGAR
jgi:hypothetical protein